MNILIIDQSKEISSRLKSLLLEETTYDTVFETESLVIAAEIIESKQPDFIIYDLSMQLSHESQFLTDTKKSCKKSVVIALTIKDKSRKQKTENIEGVDYLLDKYDDFEKLPELIKGMDITKLTANSF